MDCLTPEETRYMVTFAVTSLYTFCFYIVFTQETWSEVDILGALIVLSGCYLSYLALVFYFNVRA